METIPSIQQRHKRNLLLFIVSYVINNLASGILYDTYVNYLQEVSLNVATSFWAFYGYATFLSALLLLLVPKSGYKKLLFFCAAATSAAFFCVVYIKSEAVFYLSTLLALTGVQLHFIMLAPYVAAYTSSAGSKSIDWYTRTYYMGYVGYFLTTFLGGAATVKLFSAHAGVTYEKARELTEYITDVTGSTKAAYLDGNRDILIITGIVTMLSMIPIFFIKEEREDFTATDSRQDAKQSFKEKAHDIITVLFRKDALMYLLYWALISFAMGLFTSYYTVFLNRNLHIDKATSSLLVSISYVAIVIFMLFTPYAVKKLGTVGTICFTVLLSVPFMLIIANGDHFGKAMIPMVGLGLFMRAGLANLGSPAESSLSMMIAPKDLRPAFTSVVNFMAGIVSIISGNFTGKILFVTQEGYRTAYYIAAVLYFLAALVMITLFKKYNREEEEQ